MVLSMSHSTPDGVWRWVDNSWELIGIEEADATAFAKYCREKNQLQVGEIVLSDVSLPPDGYYVFEKFKWIKKTEWKLSPRDLLKRWSNERKSLIELQKHLDLEIDILTDDLSRNRITINELANLEFPESHELRELIDSNEIEENARFVIEFIQQKIFKPPHLCERLHLNFDSKLKKKGLEGSFWVSNSVWYNNRTHPKMDDYRKICGKNWKTQEEDPYWRFLDASQSSSSGMDRYTRPRGYRKNR
jgi:hypothetical protein